MNEAVGGYFTDMGFTVVRDIALQCHSWTAIAQVTPAQCREALRKLDGEDVDALVQVGTNLSMVRLAAAAELWLGSRSSPSTRPPTGTLYAPTASWIAWKVSAACSAIFETHTRPLCRQPRGAAA